jgi:hypothetical protein
MFEGRVRTHMNEFEVRMVPTRSLQNFNMGFHFVEVSVGEEISVRFVIARRLVPYALEFESHWWQFFTCIIYVIHWLVHKVDIISTCVILLICKILSAVVLAITVVMWSTLAMHSVGRICIINKPSVYYPVYQAYYSHSPGLHHSNLWPVARQSVTRHSSH